MAYYKGIMVFIISVLPSIYLNAQPRIDFNLQRMEGGEYLISWHAPESASLYISHFGNQGFTGEQIVSPEYDTKYSLIAEIGDQTVVKTLEAKIKGARGDNICPTDVMYTQYQYSYLAPSNITVTNFLGALRRVLQEELDFSIVSDHLNRDGKYVFETACSQRDYLLKSSENTLAGRTIAYRVELIVPDTTTGQIEYLVKCAIRYRKKVVRTWRREDDEELHLKEARRLHNKIENLYK